jgi:hypothetical protein
MMNHGIFETLAEASPFKSGMDLARHRGGLLCAAAAWGIFQVTGQDSSQTSICLIGPARLSALS